MSRGARGLIAGLVLAFVIGAGLWFAPSRKTGPIGAPTSSVETVPSGNADEIQGDLPPVSGEQGSARRDLSAPASTAAGGHVLDQAGAPIPGAELSWSELIAFDGEWEPAWQADDWGRLERQTVSARSDEQGMFVFSEPPAQELAAGSVIWATHPGHLAGALILGPGIEQGDWTIRLGPAPVVRVRVEHSSGGPVADTRVEHFGLVPGQASRGETGITEERVRRLLWRAATTGADGRVELASFPGEQILIASRGAECSLPWRGEATDGEIVLNLGNGFTLDGRISLPDWSHLDYVGERRLLITAQRGGVVHTLASIRSIEAGAFGPIPLPVLENARYRVRLEGSPIIPLQREFDTPEPGTAVHLELAAELGHEAFFIALNAAGETLYDAEALVRFYEDGRENFIRRRARPDGYINPWSFPAGTIVATISAPGYAPKTANPFVIPEAQTNAREVVLERARRVRGVCLHDGEPVESFQVVFWPVQVIAVNHTRAFHGRVDGSFELDDVPPCDVQICAFGDALPACDPVLWRANASEEEEVVLELPEALVGEGRVVDAESGEALPTADVQVFIAASNVPVTPWGTAHPVARDGSFRIGGFAPGLNFVRCRAPEYSDALVPATGTIGETLAFGQISMRRPQPLEVRLTGPPGFDFASIEAYPLDDKAFTRRRVSSDGLLRVESVPTGRLDLILVTSPGSYRRLLLDLRSREDWRYTHRVAGPKHLTVEILADEDAPPRFGGLFVQYIDAAGVPTMLGAPAAVGVPIAFEGIEAEEINVDLRGTAAEPLAASTGSFGGEEELHLAIQLGGKPLRVVVVDPEGEPVPGTRVTVQDETSPVSVSAITDGAGACEIRGIPRRGVLVNLSHSSRGSRYGIACDARREELELVLSDQATISLRFLDGEFPLADVSCRFVGPTGLPLSPAASSQPDGSIQWERLSAGTYQLSARRGDCWPLLTEVEATERAVRKDVQIRRLGSLVFQVRDRTGLPVSGQRIELTSAEFDVDVSDWLEQGSVTGASGLDSDLRGEIRLEGLPRGSYRWRFTTPAGDSFDGEIEVPAGEQASMPVILP